MSTYSKGQTWGALRKAWKGYRIAKAQDDKKKMQEYATRIRALQAELGIPQTDFKVN